jgi:hypothetical protein
MTPTDRFVPRFAAEPPQEMLPYGRWADTLRGHFLEACAHVDSEGDELGEAGEITWFPDRTWGGRTYVPATARTANELELFGYVSYLIGSDGRGAESFVATADFTDELADRNPDWELDLSDEVIGSWRGEQGNVAAMTLVWGVALVANGALATAELADLAVDQCPLAEERFTLIAPDDYRGDFLEIRLWDGRGKRLASESLYEDDEED